MSKNGNHDRTVVGRDRIGILIICCRGRKGNRRNRNRIRAGLPGYGIAVRAGQGKVGVGHGKGVGCAG